MHFLCARVGGRAGGGRRTFYHQPFPKFIDSVSASAPLVCLTNLPAAMTSVAALEEINKGRDRRNSADPPAAREESKVKLSGSLAGQQKE